MTTVNAAIAALAKHIGFPASRGRTIARQLTNAELLPLGSPGKAPEIEPHHFVSLLIGMAADTGLRTAAATVGAYADLTAGGLPSVDGVPMHLRATAADVLGVYVDMAVTGSRETQADIARMRFEFGHNWPELAIHDAGGVRRYRNPGALASHWEGQRRTSTTINGAGLVDAARDLFAKEK